MTDWTEVDNLLLDPAWLATQQFHDAYRGLREEVPIHCARDDAYGRHDWFVTRHEDTWPLPCTRSIGVP